MILYFKALIWIFFSCDRPIWNSEKMCGGCLCLRLLVSRMGRHDRFFFRCVWFIFVWFPIWDLIIQTQNERTLHFIRNERLFKQSKAKHFDKLQCHHGIRNILVWNKRNTHYFILSKLNIWFFWEHGTVRTTLIAYWWASILISLYQLSQSIIFSRFSHYNSNSLLASTEEIEIQNDLLFILIFWFLFQVIVQLRTSWKTIEPRIERNGAIDRAKYSGLVSFHIVVWTSFRKRWYSEKKAELYRPLSIA